MTLIYLFGILGALGVVAVLVGHALVSIQAFKISRGLGALVLLVPGASVYFFVKHWEKGKQGGVIVLVGLVVAVGGLVTAVKLWNAKHKPQYGKAHKITKKESSTIDSFAKRLGTCAPQVFTHKKFAYKPPKGAKETNYAKAVKVMLQEIRVCMRGQKSADGKGFSVQLQAKQLDPVLGTKDCNGFAVKLLDMAACSTMIDALIDDAGFIDPDDADDDDAPAPAGMVPPAAMTPPAAMGAPAMTPPAAMGAPAMTPPAAMGAPAMTPPATMGAPAMTAPAAMK